MLKGTGWKIMKTSQKKNHNPFFSNIDEVSLNKSAPRLYLYKCSE